MTCPVDPAAGNLSCNEQALCRACGLCCRGVWFSHVGLGEDEADNARRAGLPVEWQDGRASFQQPCVLHRDDQCSAYETWRPRKCVEYTCALLDCYVAEQVSFDDALAHVRAARTMADRVQAEAGPLSSGLRGKVFLSRLIESPEQVSAHVPPLPPLSPVAKLDAVALRIYYEKYFQKDSPPPEEDGSSPVVPSC